MTHYLWWSLCTLYLHVCQVRVTVCDSVPLVGFMYFVFTRMPGESYRGQLMSLLLCLCGVFRALINRNEFFTLRTYCTNKDYFCLFFGIFCHLSNDIKKVSVTILLSSPDNKRLYVILTLQTSSFLFFLLFFLIKFRTSAKIVLYKALSNVPIFTCKALRTYKNVRQSYGKYKQR